MAWLQIKLTATREQAPRLIEALEASGALSVSIEDAHDERVFQAAQESTPLWNENQVIGLFPDSTDTARVLQAVEAFFGADVPMHRVEILPDADWTRAWMARYQPLAIGYKLWICPSWCAPVDPAAVNIVLDPGLAFGTGEHPTTALCLEWLSEQSLTNLTVMDYGCGSGILAIAALKLGAHYAHAIDIDPLALVAARANAARNGVDARLSAAAEPPMPADIVVANILADPLIELAPRLSALVRPGGRIALTGILAQQADDVRACYAARFEFETRRRGEWVLLVGRAHPEA